MTYAVPFGKVLVKAADAYTRGGIASTAFRFCVVQSADVCLYEDLQVEPGDIVHLKENGTPVRLEEGGSADYYVIEREKILLVEKVDKVT